MINIMIDISSKWKAMANVVPSDVSEV